MSKKCSLPSHSGVFVNVKSGLKKTSEYYKEHLNAGICGSNNITNIVFLLFFYQNTIFGFFIYLLSLSSTKECILENDAN